MNDKYLQYQIVDFLADDAFVEWARGGDPDGNWERWMSSHPEKKVLIREARTIVQGMRFKSEPIDKKLKEDLWVRIERTTAPKVISLTQSTRLKNVAAVIAAAAAIALFFIIRSAGPVEFSSKSDEQLLAILPSDSKVELIGHSSIRFKKRKWTTERRVTLEGEAVFDVTKGVPFIVETNNGTVRVLGTKFRVVSRENAFYVVVESGRVEVIAGNDKQILTADQNFIKDLGDDGLREVQNSLPPSTSSTFYFDRKNLGEVIRTIEVVYGVQVVHQFDVNIIYNGSFSNSDDPGEILEAVFWTLGKKVQYQRDGQIINLTELSE